MKKEKKKKSVNVLLERTTSYAAFLYPVLILLLIIYYMLSHRGTGMILLIGGIIFLVVQYYFMFFGKKIILTDKKIYLYVRNKKVVSWDLINDFTYTNYNEDRIGKILNYGVLNIMNKDKTVHTYMYLHDCKKVFNAIIQQYENRMIEIDPTYERTQKVNNVTVDSFNEEREKE